jgi:hypothetical protein
MTSMITTRVLTVDVLGRLFPLETDQSLFFQVS